MNFSNSRRLKVNPSWLGAYTDKVDYDFVAGVNR